MNILYLCGSARSMEYAVRKFLFDNQATIDIANKKARTVLMKEGSRLFFHTYGDPERLHGMEFDAVIRDHARIDATMAQIHATEELVRIRVR